MDLLGDIGQTDQLTSAREENRVLQAKVKEMTIRIHELMSENQALQAEVELYRKECAAAASAPPSTFTRLAALDGEVYGGESKEASMELMGTGGEDYPDDYVTSGNGVFPSDPVVTLPNIHGNANPLCCALHPDDSLLATGGADSTLNLCRWGVALAPGGGGGEGEESSSSAKKAVENSIQIPCGGPVICVAFAQWNRGRGLPVVAGGCMDGSLRLAYCGSDGDSFKSGKDRILRFDDAACDGKGVRHKKYVKNVVWSPSAPIVASASADGTVQLTRIGNVDAFQNMSDDVKAGMVSMEVVQSMHFDGPVESMCFLDNGDTFCCYVRGTSYLSYFDLKEGRKHRKVSLNGGSVGTGGFDDHVSFAVLSLLPSPNNDGKYLAAATDTHRNIILETGSSRIVRNLYGHKNDGFSNPKIAWSSSGQYLYGNAQDQSHICIWDIASSDIIKRLDESCGSHMGFVRDIFSSCSSDTVATVSFDKSAKIWLNGV